jgi:hypothetical protein
MVWDDTAKQLTLGIGSTSNASRLYVRGAGTTTGFALRIADSTPTDRMVVLDNGNVGIGTTAPPGLLSVVSSSTAPTYFLNSNVGIGTSTPSYTLQVAGTAAVNTLIIGANTRPIYNMIYAFGTWPATTLVGGTGAGASLTITATGAGMGDVVMVGFSSIPSGTLSVSGLVVAANTARVCVHNDGGNASSVAIVTGTTTSVYVLEVF